MASVSGPGKDPSLRLKESYDADLDRLKERQAEQRKKVSTESEKTLENQRKAYQARIEEVKREAEADVRKAKEATYSKEAKKFTTDSRDLSDERNRLKSAESEIKAEAESRIKGAEIRAEQAIERSGKENTKKIEESHQSLARSQRDEVRRLREELDQARLNPNDRPAEIAKARAETIKEIEQGYQFERDRTVSALERDLSRMKDRTEQLGEMNQRGRVELVQAENDKTQKLIAAQKNSYDDILKNKAQAMSTQANAFEQERQLQSRQGQTALKNQEDGLRERYSDAMKAQQEGFREDLKKNSDLHQQRWTELNEDYQSLKNTDNPSDLNNKVRSKIENQYLEQQHKVVTHLENKTEKDREDILNSERKRYRELQEESAQKISKTNRHATQDRVMKDLKYGRTIEDLIEQKHSAVEDVHQRAQSKMESSQRKHSLEASVNQERHIDQLTEQREHLVFERMRSVDDTEKAARSRERDLFSQFQSQRRDLEKKMAEQADGYEVKLSELRLENEKKMREVERKGLRALEDRVRMFEHQIKQQEIASKERERFLTEHYENELDRMKRTNARLSQKKS